MTKGQSGKRSAIYDLVLEDGKVTKRTLVSTKVKEKPVTQVVQVGTKEKPVEESSSGGGTPSGGGLNWAALAECESGGNPKAVNPAGYYGLYQFSLSTWAAQGGSATRPTPALRADQAGADPVRQDRGLVLAELRAQALHLSEPARATRHYRSAPLRAVVRA